MSQPDNAAQNATHIGYATPNQRAKERQYGPFARPPIYPDEQTLDTYKSIVICHPLRLSYITIAILNLKCIIKSKGGTQPFD